MEIIKHGKYSEKKAIFTCKTCGCVFKADKLECDSKYDEGGLKLLITGCPECGAMCSVHVSAVKALTYQDLRKMDGKTVWLVSMNPAVHPGKYTVKNLSNDEVKLTPEIENIFYRHLVINGQKIPTEIELYEYRV